MTVLVHIQRFAGEKLDSDRDHSVYNTALEAGLVTPEDSQPEQKRVDDETQARREFLKKIGKGSATVPAAVLLLAASTKQAQATPVSGGSGSGSS